MRTIEKIFYNNLKKYYENIVLDPKSSSVTIINDEKLSIGITFPIQKLGGHEILRYILSITFKEIEDQWLKYREELLYSPYYANTLSFTTENYDIEKYHFSGHNLSLYGHENWEDIFNKIQVEYTIPLVNRYSNIIEVDKIINKTDKEVPYIILSNEGYPFRSVLVAHMANNPRLPEIINDMRNYCKLSYNMGLKENNLASTKLLPVFEKMFGPE